MNRNLKRALSAVLIFSIGNFACSKAGFENESTSEIAVAIASGMMNSRPDGAQAKRFRLSLISEAVAGFLCPTPVTGSSGFDCSVDETGKIMTLNYNSCNFGNNSAVWKGSVVLASSSNVSCGSFPSEDAGATLTRTFSPGTTRTIGQSVHVTKIDTSEKSGYSVPVSGGSRITYENETELRLDILGVHLTATKQFRGKGNEGQAIAVWDHTSNTASDQPLRAKRVSGGLVLNGTLITQNNLDLSTATSKFEDVTYISGCCYPASGSVTTEFSGSKAGTETLNFSHKNCGSAELKNSAGAVSNLTLVHCL